MNQTLLLEPNHKISLLHIMIERNQQKTLHKYAINQVTQCESEPQDIESKNIVATFHTKARATTLTGYKFYIFETGYKFENFYILILKIERTSCND